MTKTVAVSTLKRKRMERELEMDFCSTCGILLDLDLIGVADKCQPCKDSLTHRSCQCDFCKAPGFSNPNPNERFQTSTKNTAALKSAKDRKPNNFSHLNKAKKRQHEKASGVVDCDTRIQDDWGTHVDYREFPNPTDSNDNDGAWFKVNKKEQKKKSNEHRAFGDHDFPTLQKSLTSTAKDVEDEVRLEWERQQQEYKKRLIQEDTPEIFRLVSGHRRKTNGGRFYVGGVDISFIKDDQINACACLSVLSLPNLELVYQAMEMIKLTQPYFPGYLAFREVPPLLVLIEKLINDCPKYTPDLIMVDGNGILHPRGCGLASQLGVMLDMPTMGVAKSLISAQGIMEDESHKIKKQTLSEAGNGFDLISKETGQVLGHCLQAHDNAPNPVYVSVGHKISLKSAVWITLECCKYRVPEPVRRADLDSREYISSEKKDPYVFVK